jgi:chorismate mutase/prephenate dehydratase
MATTSSSLDDLRRRIDEIDDQIHDLVMERAAVVEAIGATKKRSGVAALRPGREAVILRRLVARHRGRFPRPVLVRLWREILSGTVMMQREFSVAVSAFEKMPDFWDMARDQFGSHMPMIAFHSVGEVLRSLAEGRVAAAVLPLPADGEREPWWPLLVNSGAAGPRVICRLPFAGRGNARGDGGLDALVVGHGEAEPTGDDRSIVALELNGELSRARLIAALKRAGLEVTLFAEHRDAAGSTWNLLEIDDMVSEGDARLATALAPLDVVVRIAHLGVYPKPFTPAALGLRATGRSA